MSAAIARAFERGGVLLAEAGTGTGKTLAYLVPAILSRERVLVSTGTKNLQEQIFFKDIPSLRDALGVPFTATYMKGRANYLCLHRLDQLTGEGRSPAGATPERPGATASARGGGAPRALSDDVFLPIIREWAGRTETGDRAELEDLPEDLPFWNDVSATAETCLGTECLRYDECFVTRMRQRAAASDVVIVNHHLLCADAAVRQSAYGEVIPGCSHAILDEAHQLEDVATQYFGFSVSNYRLEELASDAERLASAGVVEDQKARDDIAKAVDRLRDHARAFFAQLARAHRAEAEGQQAQGRPEYSPRASASERGWGHSSRGEERIRVTDASLAHAKEAATHLTGALDIVESTLALLRKPGTSADADAEAARQRAGPPGVTNDQAGALVRRAGELGDEIRFLLRASDPAYVYFVELRGRGIFLRASPIDVSAIVREVLLDRMRTTVLTSATLTVDGTFDYIRDRLGIGEADQVRLVSEFDFARQAILYLPPRMPDPRSPDFATAAGRQVVEILKRTRGRAFVLFTSYAALRAVQAIAEMASTTRFSSREPCHARSC